MLYVQIVCVVALVSFTDLTRASAQTCTVLTQDYCQGSAYLCSNWGEDDNKCVQDGNVVVCLVDTEEKMNPVSQFRPADPYETGVTTLTAIGTNTCRLERDCEDECQLGLVSLKYYCESALGDWRPIGTSYVVYSGSGVCTGD